MPLIHTGWATPHSLAFSSLATMMQELPSALAQQSNDLERRGHRVGAQALLQIHRLAVHRPLVELAVGGRLHPDQGQVLFAGPVLA